ncbi:hypothetical protein BJX63DRAFT_438683 [Aspergillus granulosus]|uniref:Uncharacterized protein n=1 Tax=Aspergillus granulosus TaxID=176169 RepID=A0ABR4GR83_9EURO
MTDKMHYTNFPRLESPPTSHRPFTQPARASISLEPLQLDDRMFSSTGQAIQYIKRLPASTQYQKQLELLNWLMTIRDQCEEDIAELFQFASNTQAWRLVASDEQFRRQWKGARDVADAVAARKHEFELCKDVVAIRWGGDIANAVFSHVSLNNMAKQLRALANWGIKWDEVQGRLNRAILNCVSQAARGSRRSIRLMPGDISWAMANENAMVVSAAEARQHGFSLDAHGFLVEATIKSLPIAANTVGTESHSSSGYDSSKFPSRTAGKQLNQPEVASTVPPTARPALAAPEDEDPLEQDLSELPQGDSDIAEDSEDGAPSELLQEDSNIAEDNENGDPSELLQEDSNITKDSADKILEQIGLGDCSCYGVPAGALESIMAYKKLHYCQPVALLTKVGKMRASGKKLHYLYDHCNSIGDVKVSDARHQ